MTTGEGRELLLLFEVIEGHPGIYRSAPLKTSLALNLGEKYSAELK